MDELIQKIDETVIKLLGYDHEAYEEAANDLTNMMVRAFPEIIIYYSDPRMSDRAEEASYWPGQLERILSAFNSGDDLATADILYNETRANLLELKSVLKEKGIN